MRQNQLLFCIEALPRMRFPSEAELLTRTASTYKAAAEPLKMPTKWTYLVEVEGKGYCMENNVPLSVFFANQMRFKQPFGPRLLSQPMKKSTSISPPPGLTRSMPEIPLDFHLLAQKERVSAPFVLLSEAVLRALRPSWSLPFHIIAPPNFPEELYNGHVAPMHVKLLPQELQSLNCEAFSPVSLLNRHHPTKERLKSRNTLPFPRLSEVDTLMTSVWLRLSLAGVSDTKLTAGSMLSMETVKLEAK